jgi:two-component system cell cycle sensor histidine kinase/response regulator CckA
MTSVALPAPPDVGIRVTEIETLRRDNDLLRQHNERLMRRVEDVEQAFEAFAAQEQLRDGQLLRAIFDATLDAIMLSDDDGRYVDVNPAACRLFGVPRGQLIGRSITDFIAAGTDARVQFRDRERGTMAGIFPLRRLDGTTATLDFNGVADVVPGRHLSILRDISDRIAAEEALRRNEALFRAVVEKSSEVISLTSADGTTRYLTPSAWRMLGWTPEEMGGRTLRDQVVPEDRALIASELARLVRTGDRDIGFEIRVMHRDGSIRWVESTGTNLLDDPDVRAIVGNYRDITARKAADEALHESRDELEEAQTLAHLGRWTAGIRPDDEITWSAEGYRIFGIPAGTAVTKAVFFASVHPSDRVRMRVALAEMLASDHTYDIEHRVQWPDGTIRWVHSRAIVDRDASHQPIRMHGTIQDVTDRHDAMAALRASEEQYRRIVENTSEGVWVYDANAVTTFMNTRMAALLGYTVEEAIGRPIAEFVEESQRATVSARIERRQRGIAERSEFRLRHKSGSCVWTSLQANPIFGVDGSFDGGIALVSDISMRRIADEVRARLAAIVESSDDAIVSVSVDGTIATWNRGAEALYQYCAEEVVGRSIALLFPPESHDRDQSTNEIAVTGDPTQPYDTRHLRKDGSLVEVSAKFSPVRDVHGTVIATAMLAKDLTASRKAEAAHRRTEEQFRQAQKMEAVGSLAAGIAHDFNNLLSVILSYSQFALEDLRPGDPLRDDMMEIDLAGRRAADLTRQLLAFSRQQILQARVLDINEIVQPMERMLRRLLGEDVTLTLLMAPTLGRVLADAGQLEQVMMNLAVNARDAMPGGGSLTIETADVHFGSTYIGRSSSIAPGNYVMVAVSDTGTGMDAVTCTRVFEPFFTTKGPGKGTGLGLSTVFGIVQQSGGHIDVSSEPGRGTTFKIYFPMTDRPAEVRRAEAPLVLRGSETILLVEDEDQVRTVATAILRRNGYNVLETSNGGEAFLVSKSFPATIHLLLTDVVMPRMSGRILAEELAPLRPDMRVLYASGYTDDAIIHHGVLEAGVAFIQKPFTPDALLRKVREVLDFRHASLIHESVS